MTTTKAFVTTWDGRLRLNEKAATWAVLNGPLVLPDNLADLRARLAYAYKEGYKAGRSR